MNELTCRQFLFSLIDHCLIFHKRGCAGALNDIATFAKYATPHWAACLLVLACREGHTAILLGISHQLLKFSWFLLFAAAYAAGRMFILYHRDCASSLLGETLINTPETRWMMFRPLETTFRLIAATGVCLSPRSRDATDRDGFRTTHC